MNTRRERKSRYLAYLLRHAPEREGLEIDRNGGWVETKKILERMNISLSDLEDIVEHDKKGRYSFEDDTHSRIRANQGHSIDVDLGLDSIEPPDTLYHGTAERNISSIMKHGIKTQGRKYVHFSQDIESAESVGNRHGKPVVLEIDSKAMHDAGHDFFLSSNGIYLAKYVPPKFIKRV